MKRTMTDTLSLRLVNLIERRGKTVSGLAAEMGRARTYLTRSITDVDQRSALTTAKIDEVLAFLEEPPSVLFAAVLQDGDQAFLDWVDLDDDDRDHVQLEQARKTFVDADARVTRLALEGLLTLQWVMLHHHGGPDPSVDPGRAIALNGSHNNVNPITLKLMDGSK